jgi:putative pyruvate formate lyase activating enzyme
MPDHVDSARRVLSFVAEELGRETFVNVMAQYRPYYKAASEERHEEINRRITSEEYQAVLEHARDLGVERIEYDPAMAGERGSRLPWR